MRHGIAKRKFGQGYDANRMLIRQLCTNFLLHNSLISTKQRIKAAQQNIERCITKAKKETEANKNYLLSFFGNKDIVNALFQTIGVAMKSIPGGYTKIKLLSQRSSDGAFMATLQWAHPIVIEKQNQKEMPSNKEFTKKEQKTNS